MAEEPKVVEVKDESQMSAEDLKALQASEDFIANFKDEDLADPDKAEELKKALAMGKTTVHQKRHYRDKVADLEKKLKPEEKKPGEVKPGEPAPVAKTEIDPYVKVSFRQDHPELSKEVAEEIFKHATAYKVSPEEALKNPIIQKYVKDNQTQNDVEDASVRPGNRSGAGVEKKDWSKASQAEIEAQRNQNMRGQ